MATHAQYAIAGQAASTNFRIARETLSRVFGQERRRMQDSLLDAALVDAGILSRGDLVADPRSRCESVCGETCTGACDF